MWRGGVAKPTIFNYLNDDCWKHVLDFVPLKDIISSERVSHQWQRTMLNYLQRTQIGINHPTIYNTYGKVNIRWMELWMTKWPSFRLWTIKLGTSVVAIYCYCEEGLAIIKENCPNLEAVMFVELREELLQNTETVNMKYLQWVRFQECFSTIPTFNAFSRTWVENYGGRSMLRFERIPISDKWLSQFLTSPVLEEIEFDDDNTATGQCLSSIKSTKLKSLVFQQCRALEFRHLLSAVNQYSMVKKLVLRDLNRDLCREIHLVVEKIHGLEHLDVFSRWMGRIQLDDCVCRLSNLKHLGGNGVATDEGLEAVSRCCKELRTVELEHCPAVTSRGIAAMCRNAGRRLLALCFRGSQHLTDDDLVRCIKSCPKLTVLEVEGCPGVSAELLARAAAARRGLRPRVPPLRVAGDCLSPLLHDAAAEEYDGLIVGF